MSTALIVAPVFGTAASLVAVQVRTLRNGTAAPGATARPAGTAAPARRQSVLPRPGAARKRTDALATELAPALELIVGHLRIGRNFMSALDEVSSTVPDPLRTLLREVVAEARLGTPVHEVLQAVMGTDAPFAIAPCGTGNDIASVLGMGHPGRLADAVASGRTRRVDAGWVGWPGGEEHFLGVLSTGFDSTVYERANGMRWPTGRTCYLASVAADLGRFRARRYTVEIDGQSLTGDALLVCVANAGTYGGGMRVCPDARIDDGALDITWVEDIPRTEFLRVLPRVFNGSHVRHPAVRTYRCASASIHAEGQVAYADGERIGPLPIHVAARPGALRVVDTAVA